MTSLNAVRKFIFPTLHILEMEHKAPLLHSHLRFVGSLRFLCHWVDGRGILLVLLAELVLLSFDLFGEWTGRVSDTDNSSLLIHNCTLFHFHWSGYPLGSQWLPWSWIEPLLALVLAPSSQGSPWHWIPGGGQWVTLSQWDYKFFGQRKILWTFLPLNPRDRVMVPEKGLVINGPRRLLRGKLRLLALESFRDTFWETPPFFFF